MSADGPKPRSISYPSGKSEVLQIRTEDGMISLPNTTRTTRKKNKHTSRCQRLKQREQGYTSDPSYLAQHTHSCRQHECRPQVQLFSWKCSIGHLQAIRTRYLACMGGGGGICAS
jgi:hypothetical protein